MSVELHDCPECTVARGGITMERAWDIFWMSSRQRRLTGVEYPLVQVAGKRYFVAGRADPTAVVTLACGHTVPS